ncbi:MAG: hypothetical protein JW854_15065 [Actinobacteria bacterium]|nr:hypothetical protein [Actinomycetota bacterium]
MEYQAETAPPNPWPDYVAFITTGSALPAGAIAFRALLRERRRKLPLYGLFWTALTTLARRDICARCPYYGEYCSTLFGKITALMWPRSDKPLARQGFYWDLVLLPVIFIYPVPEIWRGSKRLFAAYLATWALFLSAMYGLACRRCPLEACPVPR